MSEQQHVQRQPQRAEHDEVLAAPTAQGTDQGFDALLDEIDQLLETDASDYVRSFVQKGGQ